MNKRKLNLIVAGALVVSALTCFCGCGGVEDTKETVDITTVAEDNQEEDESADMSQYEKIYNKYSEQIKKDTAEYVDEVEKQADGLSNDDLYDLIQEKTEALNKTKKEGADKMTDATLESTKDDEDTYLKYYDKLTEDYNEFTKELTEIYTNRF